MKVRHLSVTHLAFHMKSWRCRRQQGDHVQYSRVMHSTCCVRNETAENECFAAVAKKNLPLPPWCPKEYPRGVAQASQAMLRNSVFVNGDKPGRTAAQVAANVQLKAQRLEARCAALVLRLSPPGPRTSDRSPPAHMVSGAFGCLTRLQEMTLKSLSGTTTVSLVCIDMSLRPSDQSQLSSGIHEKRPACLRRTGKPYVQHVRSGEKISPDDPAFFVTDDSSGV